METREPALDLSPANHVGAVGRELTTVQRDGVEVRRLIIERTYPAPIGEVWDAVTNPERIPRWFLPVSGDLRPGGRYQFEGNAGGTVLACDPPREFEVTWEYGGEVSWLAGRLTDSDTDAGTRLVLEHDAPVDPGRWEQFGPGAVGIGWELALRALAEHLATGEAVDPAQAAAWAAGPEGIAFMTGSSDAWAQASIRAGEEAEQAIAAAARCLAAYTAPEG
jgi:uncharacterized protein YndB with AHSA1/START domain